MSLPYVRLSSEEAITAKKDILSSQVNILNLIKKISSYKKQRKSELAKKTSLRRAVKHEIAEINKLLREMPDIREEGDKHIKISRESTKEKTKKKTIESELRDIQEKLARLNK